MVAKLEYKHLQELVVSPYAFETFNLSICLMLMLGCLFWNHFHQKKFETPSLNDVGLICVIFATFNFNYFIVMDSLHSCIVNVHSTMALSSSYVNTPIVPIFDSLFYHSNEQIGK
jgi:hypothetical protein